MGKPFSGMSLSDKQETILLMPARVEDHGDALAQNDLTCELAFPPSIHPERPLQQEITRTAEESLSECVPPLRLRIVRIGLENQTTLLHLATLGLLPDVEIAVEKSAPLSGPLMVRVGRAHYALGRGLAERIWVRRA